MDEGIILNHDNIIQQLKKTASTKGFANPPSQAETP